MKRPSARKRRNGPGLLKGKELATTFSFLRPNDLVWNYVVGNYLKGDKPPPFDLLYWNGDSTNLPGPLFCWYLRHTYLQNELRQPGKLTVCGEKIDLGKIKAPVFIYGSREDHIVPWDAAFESTKILKGKVRFVLGASGHIAGVDQPAGGEEAQPLGRWQARRQRQTVARVGERSARQLVDRLGGVVEAACGQAGPRAQGVW